MHVTQLVCDCSVEYPVCQQNTCVPSNLPASLTDTRSCCIPHGGTGRLQIMTSHVHDGTKSSLGGDKTAKAGPADYCLGKLRQPAHLSSSALQLPAFEHPYLLLGHLRTHEHLSGVTSHSTAGLLPCLGPKLSRGRPRNTFASPLAQLLKADSAHTS